MATWTAVGFTVLPNVGGWAGGLITFKNMEWYKGLARPSWTPPDRAFGPVWTALYTGMGFSSYLVWRDGGGFEGAAVPLGLYGAQLALNWAWTPIFFGLHSLKWSFVEILALYGAAAATTVKFFEVNQTAGYLMIPYMAWLTLASALNFTVYRKNRGIEPAKDK